MIKLEIRDIERLFYSVDYYRGMDYYREGRVSGMKQSVKDGFEQVDCDVFGSELYQVMFREVDDGLLRARCNCRRFPSTGSCKHVVAAMIYYVFHAPKGIVPVSDWNARRLLQAYEKRSRHISRMENNARLVPRLDCRGLRQNEFPAFGFRVGQEKLFVVRNIQQFLKDVHSQSTVQLGTKVSMDHSITQFDRQSRELIHILMDEFDEFRSREKNYGYSSFRSNNNKSNEIVLKGASFDRMFDVLEGQRVELVSGGEAEFVTADPQVSVRLDREGDYAILRIDAEDDLLFFGNARTLYALSGERLHRCSKEFAERVYPLFEQSTNEMKLALCDLSAFCSCVLPELEGLATVEDPTDLLQSYLPEECVPCFYFDTESDTMFLRLRFRYGEKEYPQERETGETVVRDLRKESRAAALAEQYFSCENGLYHLTGDDAVYEVLTEKLDEFRDCGEVYVSDRLRHKRIVPSRAVVGISVSDGMLHLDLDTGEFPVEELEELYQSLLKKKKYHRLKDGRFLTLDGSSYEKMAEMAHMLQLSAKELNSGELKVPAFRGLYLDTILSGSSDLNITRDRQFRQMIRNFKSVDESDYTLAPNLEQTLRPYQQTGFRWLKTLESSGFGGILADEMGLGKTLQVIAYLSTLNREETKHPSLVVCPASLVLNWGEEFQRFAPELKVTLVMGTAQERRAIIESNHAQDVWVTSYELLRQDIKQYQELEFYSMILDEGQHIKNQTTLVSKAVKAVSCRQRFVLTGTPIENRLSELWNLFDFLMPGYLFSHRAFVEKLEKPIIKSKNPEATAQLRKLVQPFVLRRMKQDVLKELPPKIEYVRRIAMGENERKTYLSAVNEAKNSMLDTGKLQILAKLTQLRQVCCDPKLCFENYAGERSKLEACMELCAGMTANGHQILLFSQFTSMLDILRERLNAMGISNLTLQGSTPKEKRAQLVKSFNAGGASVFLISLKAGGTGLNLTAADVVIHYDPWWNMAAQNQATDRAHRIGQRQCVQVYKLIVKDTIEEKILDLQERKAGLLDVISEESGADIMGMSKEDLLALLD